MSAKHFPSVVTYGVDIKDDSKDSFPAIFRRHYPDASIMVLDTDAPPDTEKVAQAEVLVADPASVPNLLEHADNLRWLQLTFAGYEPFISHIKQSGISPTYQVTRQGGTFGVAMAEYVISRIVAHERRSVAMHEDKKLKQWRNGAFRRFRLLSELTIGLIGAGDIGCKIAERCKAFGMRTIGLVTREKSEKDKSPFIDDYRLTKDLDSVLRDSDVVCNILPSNPNTVEFFKENTFQCCSKKPLFINIGRGNAVKETTIVKAIQNEWISGAVLDVFEQEPLPQESPLWDIPQVIISPHVSGVVPQSVLAELFLRNYDKFLRGEPLDYEVDVTKL